VFFLFLFLCVAATDSTNFPLGINKVYIYLSIYLSSLHLIHRSVHISDNQIYVVDSELQTDGENTERNKEKKKERSLMVLYGYMKRIQERIIWGQFRNCVWECILRMAESQRLPSACAVALWWERERDSRKSHTEERPILFLLWSPAPPSTCSSLHKSPSWIPLHNHQFQLFFPVIWKHTDEWRVAK